jgi:hypothetical protein
LHDTSINSIVLISISDAFAVFVTFVTSFAFVISVNSLAFVAFANLVVFDVVLDVLSTSVLNVLLFNASLFERRHENSNCLRCVKIKVSCKRRKNVACRRCTRLGWSSSWVLNKSSRPTHECGSDRVGFSNRIFPTHERPTHEFVKTARH